MRRVGSRARLLVGAAIAVLALPAGAGADGELDPGFGNGGSVVTSFGNTGTDGAGAVILGGDGTILTAGIAAGNGVGLSRYLTNGTFDQSYGRVSLQPFGPAPAFNTGGAAAVGPGGGIIVAGTGSESAAGLFDSLALRLTPAGDLDPAFGNDPPNPAGDGIVRLDVGSADVAAGVAIDPVGRTLLAGRTGTNVLGMANDSYVARLAPDGSPDPAWDGDGILVLDRGVDDGASDVIAKPGGRVLVAARIDGVYAVLGLTEGGALDPRFGGGDGIATIPGLGSQFSAEAHIAVQPDGRIVVAGPIDPGVAETVFAAGRLLTNGKRDRSFADGRAATYAVGVGDGANFGDLAVGDDGRIVLVGSSSAGADSQIVVLRLRPDGKPDPAFGSAGVVRVGTPGARETGDAVALQPDRRIVVGGSLSVQGVFSDRLITRLLGDTRPPDTKITRKPKRKVAAGKRAKFRFVVRRDVNATFECKLRRKRAFAPCKSPLRTKRLRAGRYVFRVRAIDPAGNVDPTPAKRPFRALR